MGGMIHGQGQKSGQPEGMQIKKKMSSGAPKTLCCVPSANMANIQALPLGSMPLSGTTPT